MFCTKCGRQLHEGDKFCAHCGARVRQDDKPEIPAERSRYEEVVFNPPFRAEAERRTKQISDEVSRYSSEPKRETVHFDWNLEGFPTSGARRNDDFELNWDAVIERRREPKPVTVEKIVPGETVATAAETDNAAETGSGAGSEAEEQAERQEAPAASVQDKAAETEITSIEELERELFGTRDMEEVEKSATIRYSKDELNKSVDQFYTYNAKRDAFQELLDRERARVEAMESERKSQWDELTHAGDDLEQKLKEPPKFEEVLRETATPLVPPLKEVGVAQPPRTLTVDAYEKAEEAAPVAEAEEIAPAAETEEIAPAAETEVAAEAPFHTEAAAAAEQPAADAADEQPAAEQPAEAAETDEQPAAAETAEQPAAGGEEVREETREKTKLRFSDVFPVNAFDADDDGGDDDGGAAVPGSKAAKKVKARQEAQEDKKAAGVFYEEDDDDEEEGRRGNRLIKAIIVVLAIVVAMEVVIIAAKAIAPDSGFSRAVDGMMNKITSLVSGQEEGTETDPASTESLYVDEYIRAAAGMSDNVGSVSADPELKYQSGQTYAFEEIGQSQEFINSPLSGDNTEGKTYGQSIVETVIGYYNNWMETNEDEDLIGVNDLAIGEIRSGGDGYYVLTRVTYAAADGGTLSRVETVRLAYEGDQLTVTEVREENI